MDDDFDFDENLLQAVDQYESSYYKSQAGGVQQQKAHQPPQQQAAPRQPLQQPSNSEVQSLWHMFCSKPPSSNGDNSSCTGWAGKRLQPRQRWPNSSAAGYNKPSSGMVQGQQQRFQQPQPQQHSCQQQQYQQQQQQQINQQQNQQTYQGQPQRALPGMQQHGNPQQHQQWSAQQPHAPQQTLNQQQPGEWQPQQQHQQFQQHSNLRQQQSYQQYQPQVQQQQSQWQQQQQQQMRPGSSATHPYGMPPCPAPHQPAPPGSMPPGHAAAAAGAGMFPGSAAGPTAAAGAGSGAGLGAPGWHAAPAGGGSGGGGSDMAAAGAAPVACSGAAASNQMKAPAAAGSGAGGVGSGTAAGAASGSAAAAAAVSGGGMPSGGPVLYTAKLSLAGKGLVEVCFSGFHAEIAKVCSSIPGARQDSKNSWSRSWLVPSDKVKQLETTLKNMEGSVRVSKFEPLPELVCKVMDAARKQPDDSHLYEALGQVELAPGDSLEQRMMPFQREGVRFGLRVGGRLLIGDEMGLGKTVQACALVKCYQAEWPVLVVTPSSLRLSWAAALYDWLRVTDDRVLVVLKKQDMHQLAHASSEAEARSMYDFVVVSYDMIKDLYDLLEAVKFEVVILDESHCIKNPTAQRTKFAQPLISEAKRAILLSGTPTMSRPGELLTQLQALLPSAKITKKAFEDRYTVTSQFGNFRKATGSKNEEELNKLLTSTVMIRRRKAEVLKDLPAKLRKQVVLMLPAAKRTELDRLKQQLQEVRKLTGDIYGVGREVGGGLLQGMEQQQRNMIMQLWHRTASIKADAVADYVAELLQNMSDPDDKFLVFAYHKELMDAIEYGVNQVKQKNKEFKNMKHMRIDGQTPAKQREANVNMFQEQADCRVAILNIKAAGVGLTLTRASTVVFAELAWTPSEVQQAEDRAHRIGQTQCVSVQLLLVKDSIDEVMWELLQNKLATTGQVLDGQAERMEVDKSGTAHRPRGGKQQDNTQADNQQKSITSFLTQNGEAPKKQRLS